ncbi:hypothetical protein IAR55_003415 [Kwoniella newhampshirensis]|uniref:GATA-type domain-containing protein n=1 Tax=Kwoniella newhampshirensis TaxID=1651941 RepID=A0AAW0YNL5_9TREE
MSTSSHSSGSSGMPGIPRVGAVRCYWALLAPRYTTSSSSSTTTTTDPSSSSHHRQQNLQLEFVHFDPVLDAHLSKQKMSMMKRNVLEFIHPNEREQARRDLSSAISADDLQGSVTRVRFARLSRIRTILGCPPEENDIPQDAAAYVEDSEYLILDLVLNWVADGLLLAFFHAIKDKDPDSNNDPAKAHEEWSNWCGTKMLGNEQIETLHTNISKVIPIPPRTRFPPDRVFQLHLANTELPHHAPQLVFSWPPPRAPSVSTVSDGLYNSAEYCEMMRGVEMDPSQLTAGPGEMRTNCTTRYGAQHSITTEGVYRHVTSVFIPYGSIIFACFQTTKLYELHSVQTPSSAPAPPPMLTTTTNGVDIGYTALSHPNPVVGAAEAPWSSNPPSFTIPGQPPPTLDWPTQGSSTEWTSSPPPPAMLSRRSNQPPAWNAYPISAPSQPVQSAYHAPPPPPHHLPIHHQSHPRESDYPTPSPTAPYHQPHHYNHTPPHDYGGAPVSTSQMSEANGSSTSGGEGGDGGEGAGGSVGAGGGRSSRPLVKPPAGVECCVMCGTTKSPEWRKNESGIKDLCNACGLRFARQVAKREGKQKPRKKKDSMGEGSTRGESMTKDRYGLSS